jgi:hypothetical protein
MKSFILTVFCIILFPYVVQADDLYTWKDDKGVTHITDQPPTEIKAKVTTYQYYKGSELLPIQLKQQEDSKDILTEGKITTEDSTKKAAVEDAVQTEEKKRMLEIEKARKEYEDAKSHEKEYQYGYDESYGRGATKRQFWRDRLDDIEKKRQRLEKLEQNP